MGLRVRMWIAWGSAILALVRWLRAAQPAPTVLVATTAPSCAARFDSVGEHSPDESDGSDQTDTFNHSNCTTPAKVAPHFANWAAFGGKK